jgi:general secretion pathway protein C
MNPRAIQWLATTVTALLLAFLGLQWAWWTWHLLTPAWQAPLVGASSDAAPVPASLGRQLFGDRDDTVTGGTPVMQNSVRLKGVFAVDGKTLSAAVVNLGGRDMTVRLNQELSSGVKLMEVQAEYIIISRNGARERIELDRFGIAKTAAAGAPAATQFRLNVASTGANAYALSRQELNTVLQDQRQMNFLGRIGPAPNGGVRVEDAPGGSLSQKLGLQAGDIITGINGQPINSQGDLVRVYGQFNSLTNIRAEVRRGGVPVVLNYAIQN